MDSIKHVLSAQGRGKKPTAIDAIKHYIQQTLDSSSTVHNTRSYYLVTVPNSAVAGALRIRLKDMEDVCKLDKKAVIKIGQ